MRYWKQKDVGTPDSLRLRFRSIWAVPLVAILAISGGALAFVRQDDSPGQTACMSNLKQISLGALMYCQDYDERFPPMKFPTQVQPVLMPYVKNTSIFSCPVTQTPYLPNPALNYVLLGQVKSPASMLLFRDAKAHTSEGAKPSWNVAYLDGHVTQVTAEPVLGKPAPTPPPLTHAEMVRDELASLKQERIRIDKRIRALEKEQARLKRKHT